LLKLMNGLIKPDAGQIELWGRVGALIELGAGFAPVLTGRENIYINASLLGLSRQETDALLAPIIDFAELQDAIDTPVQYYSSGMRLRLGYAIAAHLHPDILLVDEVLAVGDLAFRNKCLQHMQRYLSHGGALVLVSHDLHLVQAVCQRVLLLDQGHIAAAGSAVEIVNHYFAHYRQQITQPKSSTSPVLNHGNPVVIDRVSIESEQGMISTRKPVHITLQYRSLLKDIPIFWGFSIWTGDQSVCITGNGGGMEEKRYTLKQGEGALRCTIPHLPLVAGHYALRAQIIDATTMSPIARYGWENVPTLFTVNSPPGVLNNIHAMLGSLVEIETIWH
jgi:lipopolysaccharide transport system ATP-binding protein